MKELAGVQEVKILSSRYVTFIYDPNQVEIAEISQHLNEILATP